MAKQSNGVLLFAQAAVQESRSYRCGRPNFHSERVSPRMENRSLQSSRMVSDRCADRRRSGIQLHRQLHTRKTQPLRKGSKTVRSTNNFLDHGMGLQMSAKDDTLRAGFSHWAPTVWSRAQIQSHIIYRSQLHTVYFSVPR